MNLFFLLCHRLFGWHYITFQFGFDDIVRRVKQMPNGDRYVKAYGGIYFLEDGKLRRPEDSLEVLFEKYRSLTW